MKYQVILYYSNIFTIETESAEQAIDEAWKIREPVTMPDDVELFDKEEYPPITRKLSQISDSKKKLIDKPVIRL